MDMSEGIWPPVVQYMTDLPLDDPKCINESCTAWYAAANASQEAIPFPSLNVYGHWVTWFYIAIVVLLTITYAITSWQDRRSLKNVRNRGSGASICQKIQAITRSFTYQHMSKGPLKWLGLPLNGILTVLISSVLFMVLITFAVRPYYRAHLGYGSPPLAIRSGFTSFACMPILMALAGKANIISLLTGISHEKLNVVHRWVAWTSFGLAWVHTIPFFWISWTDGGAENVAMQFYMGDTGRTEWGGVIPLVVLFLLCALSLEPIRSRFYETFYQVHILLAITYFGLLYWHAANELDSWIYLYATMALWLSSWLARAFWYTKPMNIRNSWFEGSSARVALKPGNMTEIEVVAPPGFKFSPSQHVFLRVPKVELLGNHPFTICTAPVTPTIIEKQKSINEYRQTLTFLTRTHSGFTKKLASYAGSHPDNEISIWIEGPYGGIHRSIELAYDNLVLIAGGGGITACLPWISFLAQKVKAGALDEIRVRRLFFFWTVREESHLSWGRPTLENDLEILSASLKVQICICITGQDSRSSSHKSLNQPVSIAVEASDNTIEVHALVKGEAEGEIIDRTAVVGDIFATLGSISYGRQAIGEYIRGLDFEGRSFVIGCGPDRLRSDVANACAKKQMDVLRGKSQEIAVHLEAFGL